MVDKNNDPKVPDSTRKYQVYAVHLSVVFVHLLLRLEFDTNIRFRYCRRRGEQQRTEQGAGVTDARQPLYPTHTRVRSVHSVTDS